MPTAVLTPSEEVARLSDAFWELALRSSPSFGTIVGDRRYDDRLEDPSAAAILEIGREARELAAEARAIEPSGLTDAERVTRAMLIEEADGQAARIATGLWAWTVDPLEGPASSLPHLADFQPVDTPLARQRMIARWRAVGPAMDAMITTLRESLAEGHVAVRTPVERTIDVLASLGAEPPERWPFVDPARQAQPDQSPADRAGLLEAAIAAVREVIAPAFARYRAVLQDEILPVARPTDRAGLCHLPGGEAAYGALIRVHTTLELNAEAVHRTGLDEIDRIDREFVELGGRVLGTTDLPSTLRALRDDPTLRFQTAAEVHASARTTLARAQAAVPVWFGRLPKADCVVVPIPAHSAAHQTIAYYTWPAADGSRPGRFSINLHAPKTRPRYEAEALAFHEAVPGHHLQSAIAQELDDLPAFQRNLGTTAFAEGWGLYAERLADEMGLYSSDMDRFGILSFDAWRACRLVVDTGLHAFGWTRDAAIEYLAAHTALGRNNIDNEVDRYIGWPGQALAYKVGQLEILRLRAEARAALGGRFDIRAFHDTVLGSGAIGLTALRGIVGDWIARTAG